MLLFEVLQALLLSWALSMSFLPSCRHEPVSGPVVEEVEKDNSTLLDLNVRNQGLTAKDIAEMAASGKVGTCSGKAIPSTTGRVVAAMPAQQAGAATT